MEKRKEKKAIIINRNINRKAIITKIYCKALNNRYVENVSSDTFEKCLNFGCGLLKINIF